MVRTSSASNYLFSRCCCPFNLCTPGEGNNSVTCHVLTSDELGLALFCSYRIKSTANDAVGDVGVDQREVGVVSVNTPAPLRRIYTKTHSVPDPLLLHTV
eukprot:2250375-Pleurochrysis_carterae.AAC.1